MKVISKLYVNSDSHGEQLKDQIKILNIHQFQQNMVSSYVVLPEPASCIQHTRFNWI